MGILSRMSTVVKSKMNRILDNAEDPRETLDYAYTKQMETLRDVKRGVVEMVTAKRRLELQASKVKDSIAKLDGQARQAMAAGREDLARLALQRKQTSLLELEGLDGQIADLEIEQEKLTQAEQRLQAKVAAFRTRKEIVKAQYNAAQAQVRIGSALSGISEEMGDVALAVERAEHKTESMRARAGAIDELAELGVLDDFTGSDGDPLSRELSQLMAEQNVEDEIAALKGELPSGARQTLPEGNDTGYDLTPTRGDMPSDTRQAPPEGNDTGYDPTPTRGDMPSDTRRALPEGNDAGYDLTRMRGDMPSDTRRALPEGNDAGSEIVVYRNKRGSA